jgi:hypothetical protein
MVCHFASVGSPHAGGPTRLADEQETKRRLQQASWCDDREVRTIALG